MSKVLTLLQTANIQNGMIYFPKYFTTGAIIAYTVALCAVNIIYIEAAMPLWLWLFGVGSVVLFFWGSNYFTKQWSTISPTAFTQRLFYCALMIRVIYVLFIYGFNQLHYGTYYESDIGDIGWYVPTGFQIAEEILNEDFDVVINRWLKYDVEVGDLGYIFYLAFVYLLTGSVSEVVIPLLLKAVYGALSCVFAYKIAARHFSDTVGRMAGVFCMLNFMMIWWCGSMMKEAEMIFLTMWYINSMDKVLQSQSVRFKELVSASVIGLLLFTFRAALALVAFAAMFVTLLLDDSKITKRAHKIFAGILIMIILGLSYGQGISNLVQDTKSNVLDNSMQKENMEYRSQRVNGNQFAKYASATIFAPMIFTLPFPSMSYTFMGQEHIMMKSGGYFVKNVLSYFVILSMVVLLLSRQWRKHVFPIAFLCGYLVALVFSNFAQSGRFHMPIIPLLMIFSALGIQYIWHNKRYWKLFNYVLFLEIILCLAWNWFKLAGRGLI